MFGFWITKLATELVAMGSLSDFDRRMNFSFQATQRTTVGGCILGDLVGFDTIRSELHFSMARKEPTCSKREMEA